MDKIIIEKPIVSEKSSMQLESNVYHFVVKSDAKKIEIKQFIETNYKVDVVNVNVLNVKSKVRVRGRIKGKTASYKKAYITVKKGQKIEAVKEEK